MARSAWWRWAVVLATLPWGACGGGGAGGLATSEESPQATAAEDEQPPVPPVQNPPPEANLVWKKQTSGIWTHLRAVQFVNTNIGYAVGDSGVILRSIDGGVSWTQTASPTTAGISDLFCKDADRLLIVSGKLVFGSPDGGQTWMQASVPALNQSNHAIFMSDDLNGCAVGPTQQIIRTQDGGQSWTLVHLQTSAPVGQYTSLLDVACFDAYRWIAVGSHGSVLRSFDAGATWTSVRYGSEVFRAVSVAGENGLAVGDNGAMARTEDGGLTWTTLTSGVTSYLFGAHFLDGTRAWAVGGGNQTVLKTVDGGATWASDWSYNPAVHPFFNDVQFVDAGHGWIVGGGGTILALKPE